MISTECFFLADERVIMAREKPTRRRRGVQLLNVSDEKLLPKTPENS